MNKKQKRKLVMQDLNTDNNIENDNITTEEVENKVKKTRKSRIALIIGLIVVFITVSILILCSQLSNICTTIEHVIYRLTDMHFDINEDGINGYKTDYFNHFPEGPDGPHVDYIPKEYLENKNRKEK